MCHSAFVARQPGTQTFVAAFAFAPRFSSSTTTCGCPSLEARCRAFSPFCKAQGASSVSGQARRQTLTTLAVSMSMLPLRYSSTLSKLPARAARRKLLAPSV